MPMEGQQQVEDLPRVLTRIQNLELTDEHQQSELPVQQQEQPLNQVDSASPQNMQPLGQVPVTRARRPLNFLANDDEQQPSSSTESCSSSLHSDDSSSSRPASNAVNVSAVVTHNENRIARGRVSLAGGRAERPARANYNWQGSKTTVRERFSFLFNNDVLSDVTFLVGRGVQQRRIPAHKLVLASGSAVFDAMFNGTLATAASEIEVPDVEPSAFLAVLLFLYTDEIEIDAETVTTTLYTAKKYAVSPLEKHCVEFLRSNLTSDNAFLLLTQARLFDEPQLAAVCLDMIDKFTTEALNADGFSDVDIDTLMTVLERDTLRIRESKIFQAVVRWSEAECVRQQLPVTPENQRSVLGKALSLVRFPLMSAEEFAIGPAQSGLLPDREVVSLFIYFTLNPKPSIGYQAIPRCCMMGKEQTVCRFQSVDKRWGYKDTSDRIRFSVDKRIFLVGYGVYGSVHGPAEYQVLIKLIHAPSESLITEHMTSVSCDGSRSTYRLMFKEPLEIQPNTIYTASATFKGPDSYYGKKGMRTVIVNSESNNSRVKFNFHFVAGNNNGTTIEEGQIPELIFYT